MLNPVCLGSAAEKNSKERILPDSTDYGEWHWEPNNPVTTGQEMY